MFAKTHRVLALVSLVTLPVLAGCSSSDEEATEPDLADQNDDETPVGKAADEARSGSWAVSWARSLCLRRTNSKTGTCFRKIGACEAIYVSSVDGRTGMARVRHGSREGYVNKGYLTTSYGQSDGTTTFECRINQNGVITAGGTS